MGHPSGFRGRIFQVESAVFLPRALDEVFPFFSDAYNLEQITPPFLKFQVETPKPIPMRAGALIDYKLRVRGLPIRWKTEIMVWEPPYRFVDNQLSGPYKLWWHEHTFESVEGGTICRDRVDYAPPFGRLANWLVVARDVRKIFDYRTERLIDIFGGGHALEPGETAPRQLRAV